LTFSDTLKLLGHAWIFLVFSAETIRPGVMGFISHERHQIWG